MTPTAHPGRFALSLVVSLSALTVPPLAAEPVVMKPSYKVRVERHVQIPVRDGVKLSADLIRPDAEGKFPAVIEYMPYRKDDLSLSRAAEHYYWAERGLVGVRLDVRGTGGSEGVNTDEYMPEVP